MHKRLLLLGSDLGDLLAIPFHLSPKCTGRAALLVILVRGIFALAVERRRCSQVVAQRLGWRESERFPCSSLFVTSLCDTGRVPLHNQIEW
jgi:hypothetical protein